LGRTCQRNPGHAAQFLQAKDRNTGQKSWILARKKERDLQIGFKAFYAPFVLEHNDPLRPVVVKNAELIKQMIGKAIDEISKE
jgi:hypothetical protein